MMHDITVAISVFHPTRWITTGSHALSPLSRIAALKYLGVAKVVPDKGA